MFIDTHHKGRNSDMLGTQPNILVFGAHAADYCFRSGGTILRYLDNGSRVRVVSATFGEKGESAPQWATAEATLESVKGIRRAEAEKAASILGVEIKFLDLGDNPLFIDNERMDLYVEEICDFLPDIILTHWTYEPTNQDHQIVGEAAIRAVGLARAKLVQDNQIFKRPRIFLFEPDILSQPILNFVPDTYIDFTPYAEQKFAALSAYLPSQPGINERWPERGKLRGLEASNLGGLKDCKYAEAFKRFQPYAGDFFV